MVLHNAGTSGKSTIVDWATKGLQADFREAAVQFARDLKKFIGDGRYTETMEIKHPDWLKHPHRATLPHFKPLGISARFVDKSAAEIRKIDFLSLKTVAALRSMVKRIKANQIIVLPIDEGSHRLRVELIEPILMTWENHDGRKFDVYVSFFMELNMECLENWYSFKSRPKTKK